ncbi:MAG: hypothetical protein WA655_17770 [Candidatus Korobacteraceae bacterium]
MLALPKTLLATALTAAIFFLSACSQPSNPLGGDVITAKASEPANLAAPVTAKAAYVSLYKSAYKWTPDAVMLRLEPKEMPGFQNGGGKAALWEGTFASASQHVYRIFTYAIAAHPPDIYQGVSIGRAIPWGGVTRDAMPIEASEFLCDSDAAYTAAAADAAAWLKKNPDKKLSELQLGNGYRFPGPIWYVMWGDKKSGYVAYVNATTGKVMKK